MYAAYIFCFVQVLHLAYNHKKIKSIVNLLDQDSFTNHTLDKEVFLEATRKTVIRNSVGVMLFYLSSGMSIGIAPIFDAENKKLPLMTWYPFDYSNPVIFSLIYIYEFLGINFFCVSSLISKFEFFGKCKVVMW